jgi:type IV pilus assembly protein PilY1
MPHLNVDRVTGRSPLKYVTHGFAAALLMLFGTASHAEDIDLFVQPGGAAGAPNVLIVLDNTANWNTPFPYEKAALVETVKSLLVANGAPAKVRVGLMLFTESGGANKGEDGGYVRSAIRDFSGSYQSAFVSLVESLDTGLDKSDGGKAAKTMADAYAYFAGRPPLTGNTKVKTDFSGNARPGTTVESRAVYALPGNALTAFDGTPYTSPVAEGFCGGNYIIYISNSPAQDNTADLTKATQWLSDAASAAGISNATATIPISPSGSMENVADEWARFMRKSPLGIKIYTLDVYEKSTGQTDGWSALLASMAKQSDGEYYLIGNASAAGAATRFRASLQDIFTKIQSVNSVFASVSLPISVTNQGNYLNQVYIGMFRPSPSAMARWDGNLKQYKLGIVGNDLRLLDADGATAINSNTGFVSECARSFWTPSTLDSYWSFRPQGECLAAPNSDVSNYPDGRIVEKGGSAIRLRATARTRMTTCVPFADCNEGPLEAFSTSNADIGTALGTNDATERTALINWAIGANNKPVDTDGIDDTDDDDESGHNPRPSIHGDVIHSRPVALNYGDDTNPKVVVFYAANDGVLRAINGNRTTSVSGVPAGGELWSFMPPQFLPHIKRLRDNTIEFDYEGSTNTAALPKPYGVDGPITVYRDGAATWLFTTMRRGGRALYAFDVSSLVDDDSRPTTPQLKWRLGCPGNFAADGSTSDTGCTSGSSDIGQTWSGATVVTLQNRATPVLLMGGGYDTCEDSDPHSCTVSVKGNGVYVIDATDGTILARLPTDRPVIADVAVDKGFQAGDASWAYVADLGGNVYRISGATPNSPFAQTSPENWTITKVASLGCPTAAPCPTNRKFMFTPDIVEKSGTYFLMLGSGDREKPLRTWTSAYGTSNYFFMVKDVPRDPLWLSGEQGNCGQGTICLQSLLAITTGTPSSSDLALKKGWYLALNPHEQVVTSAITVFGTTTFSTHTPVPLITKSCTSNLGTARVYNIGFMNAAPRVGQDRSAVISGGGLPPSPVAGRVTLDGPTPRTVPFIIGGDARSPLEGKLPSSPSSQKQPKSLTYWYLEK